MARTIKFTSRRVAWLGVAALAGGICWNRSDRAAETTRPAPDAEAQLAPTEAQSHPLVVHEWGTFTSFSGSDGVQLDFRPLVDSDLPGFIYRPSDLTGLSKRNIYARQRMETPVTYFYSDVERDVHVAVRFPAGRLTEFYPPPLTQHSPNSNAFEPGDVDEIDWGTVHIIPTDTLQTQVAAGDVADRVNRHVAMGLTPWTDDYNPYYRARETDSALLYVRRTNDPEHPTGVAAEDFKGDHFEKFLFYRGAGNFELPISVQALGADRVRIVNMGPQEISAALVVNFDGQRLRSRLAGSVGPNDTLETSLPPWPEVNDDTAGNALDQSLMKSLTGAGLFEKEALAMVNTWRSSWYREPGTRVFYIVPQELTESILPLQVDPSPQSTVRVLVARLEFLTPEEQDDLGQLLQQAVADHETAEPALFEQLRVRGRLAEPALMHVAKLSADPAVQAEAERVRTALQQGSF